jgi:hypothetical protein
MVRQLEAMNPANHLPALIVSFFGLTTLFGSLSSLEAQPVDKSKKRVAAKSFVKKRVAATSSIKKRSTQQAARSKSALDKLPGLESYLDQASQELATLRPELTVHNLLTRAAMGKFPSRGERYPWKTGIVTTTFWVGEAPTKNNPTPNYASSWDTKWARNYGGYDNPDRSVRSNYIPVKFTPRQNPFYIALPYNDIQRSGTKPEAAQVIPWFKETFERNGKTVLKGRWVAVRYKGKVAYAQWEDCGPFRTDHWQYVFGNERPKPNLNKGAGLDVSPAVRDYLGMRDTDVTDWRFVEFEEVPRGPWAIHGDNNTFVQNARDASKRNMLASDVPVR